MQQGVSAFVNGSLNGLCAAKVLLYHYTLLAVAVISLCSAFYVLKIHGHTCYIVYGVNYSFDLFVLDSLIQLMDVFRNWFAACLGYVKNVHFLETYGRLLDLDLLLFLRAVCVVYLITAAVLDRLLL